MDFDNDGLPIVATEESTSVAQIKAALAGQHAIHGMLGRVFERLGGEDFMFEWAQNNPGRFLNMMVKATPSIAPTEGLVGDVHLHVHQSLVPTKLDE